MKSDHELHDRRSLKAHKLIAEKLRENPTLLDNALKNLARAREISDSDALLEWEVVLRAPVETICKFIVSESATATRMRQSTPFSGVLTISELHNLRKIETRCPDQEN
jgi:hypothetical protein